MYLTGLTIGSIVVLAVIVVVWGISVYNRLINMRTLKEEGWSGIDVQLKRRHDLIGNLVNTIKGYMQHEKAVLEEIARLRTAAQQASGVANVAAAESGLNQALGRLFAVMENHPDLKANTNAMHLQESLTVLEDDIHKARRYYNATVRDLNIIIQSFPSNIIARRFNFKEDEFFELNNAAEAAVPEVYF
ncbi:LemA family protein [Desulfovibrio sp. OttesenSCG-928-C14]|nr:LemA family protein [Desulfovibrio sp. OttesenSCG-928-C14]MDL2313533.1 LemA family protein [Desulfovibrio sp. OttesenSCG-928-C14]